MSRSAVLEEWESRLRLIFLEIDNRFEAEYGNAFPLHPARPRRGTTSASDLDGLFYVGASFSAGYGSAAGEGYVVEIKWSTLATVPQELRRKAEDDALAILNQRLPQVFPGKGLRAVRDGDLVKIIGDLSI